jgi:HK97 family phage portal protein
MQNPFKGLFRSRDKPVNFIQNYGFLSMAGTAVTPDTAMQNTAVFACVKVLSETLASLPIHIFRFEGNKRIRVPEHPLSKILSLLPNAEMTAYTFIETAMIHLLTYGNFYAQIVRNGKGQPLSLYPLLPQNMDVSRDTTTGRLVYTYTRNYDEYGKPGITVIPNRDILHVPGLGFDGIMGFSPISMARNAIGMGIAVEQFGSSFFANGALPAGVLESPTAVKNPDKLKESWNTQFGGGKAHGTALLEEGLKYHTITIPPNDAQFLETRRFQTEEIARVFRVPLHMIGDYTHATFSNVEHLSLDFVKFSLTSWITRLEQGFEKALLLPSEQGEYFIKFNVDGLLRGDYQSRMSGYAVGIQNGFMSVNDIRDLEDMNEVPEERGGNIYMVNGNMKSLKDVMLSGTENEQEGG